jgi:hypothetical protein
MKHGHSLGLIFTEKASDATRIITQDKLTIIKKMRELKFTLNEIACVTGVTINTISKQLKSVN